MLAVWLAASRGVHLCLMQVASGSTISGGSRAGTGSTEAEQHVRRFTGPITVQEASSSVSPQVAALQSERQGTGEAAQQPEQACGDLHGSCKEGTQVPEQGAERPAVQSAHVKGVEPQQQQQAGAAAEVPAEAAGSPQQQPEGLRPGPVFVPIILCMDDDDHELLVREWHARQAVCVPCTPYAICVGGCSCGHQDSFGMSASVKRGFFACIRAV